MRLEVSGRIKIRARAAHFSFAALNVVQERVYARNLAHRGNCLGSMRCQILISACVLQMRQRADNAQLAQSLTPPHIFRLSLYHFLSNRPEFLRALQAFANSERPNIRASVPTTLRRFAARSLIQTYLAR